MEVEKHIEHLNDAFRKQNLSQNSNYTSAAPTAGVISVI